MGIPDEYKATRSNPLFYSECFLKSQYKASAGYPYTEVFIVKKKKSRYTKNTVTFKKGLDLKSSQIFTRRAVKTNKQKTSQKTNKEELLLKGLFDP